LSYTEDPSEAHDLRGFYEKQRKTSSVWKLRAESAQLSLQEVEVPARRYSAEAATPNPLKLRPLTREYTRRNARQKENFNFQKISAVLADYGFVTMRLSDDLQGADFIALHIDGETVLRVQLPHRHAVPTGARLVSTPVLNGLHHEYRFEREAA